jgi:heme/copper-type cytochrome/quinol oxidase subunit 2
VWDVLPSGATAVLRLGATVCGAAVALLYFSMLVWTARDIGARSRDGLVRLSAVLLVLVLNVLGLLVYVLLRPRETVSERYERELIEEVLAREVSSYARAVPRVPRTAEGYRRAPPAPETPEESA